MWERDTIATAEAAMASTEEDGSKGALLGLKRAWPTFVGCGHCRTEAEEEGGAAAGEEYGTTGVAAEGEIDGYRLGGIHCREEKRCFNLFKALIPS